MKILLRICCACLSLSLAALNITGKINPQALRLGTREISRQNEDYLTNTFNKALAGFGVMSAIKTGLAIIEGSTAGVSAGATVDLQIGDAVQAAYDYVDIAWRTLLIGCISLLSIQHLLKAADLASGFVLGFMLIVLGIYLVVCGCDRRLLRTRDLLKDLLSVSIVATLALFYILPLSVWGASVLSRMITQPQIEAAQSGFQETKDALFPEEKDQKDDGFLSRMKKLPERVQQIANFLKEQTAKMAIWTIQLIAGYLFDCILFPVSLFALLLWLTRSILRYIFHKNLQSSLRADLERIFIARNE